MLLKIPSSTTIASDDDMPGGAGGAALNDMLADFHEDDLQEAAFYEADLEAQNRFMYVDELSASPFANELFDEYTWMMNEEEFDKQEMQRLEEQELIAECLGAMNDELNGIDVDDDDDEDDEFDIEDVREYGENPYGFLNDDDDDEDHAERASDEDGDSIQSHKVLSPLAVSGDSKLNPLAEVFVPAEVAPNHTTASS